MLKRTVLFAEIKLFYDFVILNLYHDKHDKPLVEDSWIRWLVNVFRIKYLNRSGIVCRSNVHSINRFDCGNKVDVS